MRGSRCRHARVERVRVVLLDGDFAVGVDVGVFGELVSVAVDVVRVPGARGGYGGDPSEGPGPVEW